MNLRHCDYCGNQFKELSRVEVGKRNKEWFVCADCLTNKMPRISKETEVPLLSTLFQFGASKAMSTLRPLPFQYNDGGRTLADFKGKAGDCVTRAVSIAAQRSYSTTYFELATIQSRIPKTKRRKKAGIKSANNGIYVRSKLFKDYMKRLGFRWVSTMQIGSGCKVHLAAGELPMGRLVVQVSKHMVAVIDGVVHDTYKDDRDGTRCVYGYYIKEG